MHFMSLNFQFGTGGQFTSCRPLIDATCNSFIDQLANETCWKLKFFKFNFLNFSYFRN